ncbi:MAG: hypothetical protein ABWY65_06245 [Thermoleophilaceae bacterium]
MGPIPAAGAHLLDTFPRDEFWELTHTDEERHPTHGLEPFVDYLEVHHPGQLLRVGTRCANLTPTGLCAWPAG